MKDINWINPFLYFHIASLYQIRTCWSIHSIRKPYTYEYMTIDLFSLIWLQLNLRMSLGLCPGETSFLIFYKEGRNFKNRYGPVGPPHPPFGFQILSLISGYFLPGQVTDLCVCQGHTLLKSLCVKRANLRCPRRVLMQTGNSPPVSVLINTYVSIIYVIK